MYNGWTNYETWVIFSWLTSDDETLNIVDNLIETSKKEKTYKDVVSTLETEIKKLVEDNNPLAEDSSLYSDLLSSALYKVDWEELVKYFSETIV